MKRRRLGGSESPERASGGGRGAFSVSMDSVTQAALGAVVARADWHGSLGCEALFGGAALGTWPDLEIVAYPWLDAVERLYWHRGYSHGLPVLAAAAIGLAWVVRRVHPRAGLSWARAGTVAFFVFGTHVAIDWFTVYGTQLWAPLTTTRYSLGNLFIIDPLYTLPLLVGMAVAIAVRGGPMRARASVWALAASTLYVGWSIGVQAWAAGEFRRELERREIAAGRGLTTATAFNAILWRHLAPVEGGFVIGFRSIFDGGAPVEFVFVPQEAERVELWRGSRELEALKWFSRVFSIARPADARGVVRVADLRFGELRPRPGADPNTWSYVFVWDVGASDGTGGGAPLVKPPQVFGERGATLRAVWRRARGEVGAW